MATKSFATKKLAAQYAVAVLVTAMLTGAPVFAQSVPADQSCGGLLCDMGVFGHKTEPKPAPAPVHAAVVSPPVAAESADPEPKPKAARKKKHVAKAAKDKIAPREADPSETEAKPVPVASVAKPATVRPSVVKTGVAKASAARTSAAAVPVPFGWQTTATQPPVAPEQQAEPVAPAPPQVAQAKPKPADGSMPVNVINLYSSLPSAGIRPLY